ncbi:unnamed protein product, partial [Notodromas monacha]
YLFSVFSEAADGGASPVYFDPNNLFQTAESDFPALTSVEYATRTVYGFLDFTTTMGNTVMIFKPGSEPDESTPELTSSSSSISSSSIIISSSSRIAPSKTQAHVESSTYFEVIAALPETITPALEPSQLREEEPEEEEIVSEVLPTPSKIDVKNLFDEMRTVGLEEEPEEEEIVSEVLPTPSKIDVKNLFDEMRTVGLEGLFSGFDLEPVKPKKQAPNPVVKQRVETRVEENVNTVNPVKPQPRVSVSTNIVITSPKPAEVSVSPSKSKPAFASSLFELETLAEDSVLTPVHNGLVSHHYDFYYSEPKLSIENSFRSEERLVTPSKPKVDVQSKVDVRVEVNDGKQSRRKPDVSIIPPIPEKKPKAAVSLQPSIDATSLGVLTTLGGTTVMTGTTTVHETKVVGTVMDGVYAQVLQSTSHIFVDNDEYFSAPNPGLGEAVVDEVKTVHSVITGGSTTVIAPVLEGTVDPEVYNFRSRAPQLMVDYEDFEVEPNNDELFVSKSKRPKIVSTPLYEPAAVNNKPEQQQQQQRRGQQGNEKRLNAQEDLLTRLRKNKQKFERLTAEPTAPKPERRAFNPSKRGSQQGPAAPPPPPSGRHNQGHHHSDNTATVLYAEPARYSNDFDNNREGGANVARRRQTRYRKKIGPVARPSEEVDESPVIRTAPRPFNSRPHKVGGNNHAAKTVKIQPTSSSSIYRFKLNRPSGRWRWQAAAKPKIVIKSSVQASSPNPSEEDQGDQQSPEDHTIANPDYYNDNEEDLQTLEASIPELETLNVEMSTPEPFENTYYEIATIKSPYVYHVGQAKTTRYIMLTSTIERFIDRRDTNAPDIDPSSPDSEELIQSTRPAYHENLILDDEIMTLPPIGLAGDLLMPLLETRIESFSTSELMLKTTVLPVVKADGTSYHTLTQSYYITRVVTALKTMPPMDAYKMSHPHDDLEHYNDDHLALSGSEGNGVQVALPPDFFDDQDLVLAGAKFNPNDMEKKLHPEYLSFSKNRISPSPSSLASGERSTAALGAGSAAEDPSHLQQLAYLKFLNPYLNIGGGAGNGGNRVITNSVPVVKTETLYKTDVLPIWDGVNTHYSTITHPIGTTVRTDYEYVTTEVPQAPFAAPFQPPIAPFAATVSTPVTLSTRLTSTSTKVYKITLQAKPIFTTITSTRVYDTVITTYTTSTMPAPPALPYLPFPGYFG